MAVLGAIILIVLAFTGFFKGFTGCTWILVITFTIICFAVHPVAGGFVGFLAFVFGKLASATIQEPEADGSQDASG